MVGQAAATAAVSAETATLVEGLRAGNSRALARVLSAIENAGPAMREIAAALTSSDGRARIIGITGSPGVGKSTSTAALVGALRAEGRRVAVLAVDPSSPFTGGALLGDRVRMQDHATDGAVFIRSMATRGHLGGLAAAAPQAVRALGAAGYDDVLVETVGVGQAEVEIARLADVTMLLLAPGMGDGIQAAKAGIIEIADILVVNKADRDGAQETVRELRAMLALGGQHSTAGGWRPPILSTVAVRGEGLEDVMAALTKHADWSTSSGAGARRRTDRIRAEIEAIAIGTVRADLESAAAPLSALTDQVAAGTLDVYAAADALLAGAGHRRSR